MISGFAIHNDLCDLNDEELQEVLTSCETAYEAHKKRSIRRKTRSDEKRKMCKREDMLPLRKIISGGQTGKSPPPSLFLFTFPSYYFH